MTSRQLRRNAQPVTPAQEPIENLMARDLAAWREAKAAIENAKGAAP
jgi:hypothetical protein